MDYFIFWIFCYVVWVVIMCVSCDKNGCWCCIFFYLMFVLINFLLSLYLLSWGKYIWLFIISFGIFLFIFCYFLVVSIVSMGGLLFFGKSRLGMKNFW